MLPDHFIEPPCKSSELVKPSLASQVLSPFKELAVSIGQSFYFIQEEIPDCLPDSIRYAMSFGKKGLTIEDIKSLADSIYYKDCALYLTTKMMAGHPDRQSQLLEKVLNTGEDHHLLEAIKDFPDQEAAVTSYSKVAYVSRRGPKNFSQLFVDWANSYFSGDNSNNLLVITGYASILGLKAIAARMPDGESLILAIPPNDKDRKKFIPASQDTLGLLVSKNNGQFTVKPIENNSELKELINQRAVTIFDETTISGDTFSQLQNRICHAIGYSPQKTVWSIAYGAFQGPKMATKAWEKYYHGSINSALKIAESFLTTHRDSGENLTKSMMALKGWCLYQQGKRDDALKAIKGVKHSRLADELRLTVLSQRRELTPELLAKKQALQHQLGCSIIVANCKLLEYLSDVTIPVKKEDVLSLKDLYTWPPPVGHHYGRVSLANLTQNMAKVLVNRVGDKESISLAIRLYGKAMHYYEMEKNNIGHRAAAEYYRAKCWQRLAVLEPENSTSHLNSAKNAAKRSVNLWASLASRDVNEEYIFYLKRALKFETNLHMRD